MTAPSATCELHVDGTRVPDTGAQLGSGGVTALSSLSLTWGRDGANEQPGPATADFTLTDPVGADDFLDVLHVGSVVEVWAEGSTTASGAGAYVQTFDDGTFESWPIGPVDPLRYKSTGGPLTVTTEAAPSHTFTTRPTSAQIPAGTMYAFEIPPRTFSPEGSLPNAWDDIPRWVPGDRWGYSVDVWAPIAGLTLRIGLSVYSSPWKSSSGQSSVFTLTSVAGWQTITHELTSGYPSPMWAGLSAQVEALSLITWAAQLGTWAEQGVETWADQPSATIRVDNVTVGPKSGSIVTRRVLTFSGSVSDITATPTGDGALTVRAIAADLAADLGNRVIGDAPWAAQAMSVRAARIVALAQLAANSLVIDEPLGDLIVSYRDVDAQPSYALLQDLAQTVGGVLWASTHAVTGPYLRVENPATRTAARQLVLVGTAPAVDATNSHANPSLESGVLDGWVSTSSSVYVLSLDSVAPISGAYSALTTRSATSPNTTAAAIQLSNPSGVNQHFPVAAGDRVTASLDVKVELPGRRIRIWFAWYDAANTMTTSPVIVAIASTVAGTVYRVSNTETAPAGTVAARLRVSVDLASGNATTGERAWFDRACWGLSTYFDGDTAADATYSYRWTGTPRASTSERLTGSGTIQIESATGRGVITASACDILLDPVTWRQATEDVITSVAVSWQEQTVDDDGLPAPTERTYTTTDTAAQATYGTRRLSLSTELTTVGDATDIASRLLAQARAVGWRLDGITLDTAVMPDEIGSLDDSVRQEALLDLLDGTTRMGAPLTLVDMPPYAPRGAVSSVYVEGGKYEYAEGAWSLALTTTPTAGTGTSVTWADLAAEEPAWTWIQWAPTIVWSDLYGVSV
jgi:hypothetical protein